MEEVKQGSQNPSSKKIEEKKEAEENEDDKPLVQSSPIQKAEVV